MNRLMNRFMDKRWIFIILLILSMLAFMPRMAPADTSNPSPASSGYMVLPLVIDGQLTATAGLFRIQVPFPARVVSITVAAESIDSTTGDEAYSVDVLEAGTTILSSAVSIAAADTVYAATIADAALADEAVITGTLTASGTTPIISGITVLMVLKRL